MKKVGTKTVRKIAKGLEIYTGYSWTDKPYVNEDERYVVFAGGSQQEASDLEAALFELGYEGSTVRYTECKYSYQTYIRIAKCLFEK